MLRCQSVLCSRDKSLTCRVSSVVEQRFCNSALAIPPRFIECRLVNVFGPKMPSSARHHASPSHRVPPNSFAKMLAAQSKGSGLARRWTRHGLLWRVWPAGDLALAGQAACAALGNYPRRSELSCCGKTTLFREHANYLCTTALLRRGLFSCAADLSACPQFAEMPQ